MAEFKENEPRPNVPERTARLYRNWNAFWAMTFSSVAVVIPGPNVFLGAVAAVNAVQAGAGEWVRSQAQKKRQRHSQ